jgi:heme-degrading monooxygenase HmoA
MHAMTRSYSGKGAKEFLDIIEKKKGDVEKVVWSVKGLVSYTMVRTADGGFSVSVWEDKASIDEVHKKAMAWMKENASDTKVGAPTVTEGSVVLQLK